MRHSNILATKQEHVLELLKIRGNSNLVSLWSCDIKTSVQQDAIDRRGTVERSKTKQRTRQMYTTRCSIT